MTIYKDNDTLQQTQGDKVLKKFVLYLREVISLAVVVRLTRGGSNKRPVYRLVAADSRSPRDGKYLEIVGTYDPRAEENQASLKLDRIEDWIQKGAQLSDTVNTLYKQAKAANA